MPFSLAVPPNGLTAMNGTGWTFRRCVLGVRILCEQPPVSAAFLPFLADTYSAREGGGSAADRWASGGRVARAGLRLREQEPQSCARGSACAEASRGDDGRRGAGLCGPERDALHGLPRPPAAHVALKHDVFAGEGLRCGHECREAARARSL